MQYLGLVAIYNREDELYVELDQFVDLWLEILMPELDKLKGQKSRVRKIYTLKDLSHKNVTISSKQIEWLIENCQFSNTLDEMISSCIIAIDKTQFK